MLPFGGIFFENMIPYGAIIQEKEDGCKSRPLFEI